MIYYRDTKLTKGLKMFNKIKRIIADYKNERRRVRFLHEKLELLTDPTFLDRALADGRN